jgi:8-oxo-dGTP pyrophosphatase MutT (NUDIX family)
MSIKPGIKETICAVITYKTSNNISKFLLLKSRKNKKWDFVKGQISLNNTTQKREDDFETLVREIKEETRIIINKSDKIPFLGKYQSKGKLKRFYYVKVNTDKVELSDEHTNYEWMAYKEAKEKLTLKESKKYLKKSKQFLKDGSYVG